jgi:hypothetical protein
VGSDERLANHPHSEKWSQINPPQPTDRLPAWPAVVLAALAALVAAAALVVALTRPSSSPSPETTKGSPYSAAEIAAAQQQLCDTYKLVAKAVQVDTNGNNPH